MPVRSLRDLAMNESEAIRYLREIRLISDEPARATSLAGGVSSDIYLIETTSVRLVLKQAVARLRVQDDWYCDPARCLNEFDAISYARSLFSEAVPQTVHVDRERLLFVMEYVGDGFSPWKHQLLSGMIEPRLAELAGRLLATLHSASWRNDKVAQRFDGQAWFYSLRIEPYLLKAAERNPTLSLILQKEAQGLQQTRLALIHGDWSSKNMLTDGQRIVVLDWEVACFADPAFDVAFFMNLIYLKSLYNRKYSDDYFRLINAFLATYQRLNPYYDGDLERRIIRLTLMLMLARIDGKSPVEYITELHDRDLVRYFVRHALLREVSTPADLEQHWRDALHQL